MLPFICFFRNDQPEFENRFKRRTCQVCMPTCELCGQENGRAKYCCPVRCTPTPCPRSGGRGGHV